MNEESEHNPFWMRRAFWIVLYVCLWIGSLVVGIAGAIPYGGGGGAIRLWAALTWLLILLVAFQLLRALLSPIFRLVVGKTAESDVDPGAAVGNRQSAEPVTMCKHCHTETPLKDSNCAWCGERLENEG